MRLRMKTMKIRRKMETRKLSDYKALETVSVLAMAGIVMGFVFRLKIFFIVSFVLLLTGIFFKRLSLLIAQGWLKFAYVLGTINSKIVLTLIFFLFLTPIAFLYRVIKGDFMRLRKGNGHSKSYWVEKNHQYKSKDLENVW